MQTEGGSILVRPPPWPSHVSAHTEAPAPNPASAPICTFVARLMCSGTSFTVTPLVPHTFLPTQGPGAESRVGADMHSARVRRIFRLFNRTERQTGADAMSSTGC